MCIGIICAVAATAGSALAKAPARGGIEGRWDITVTEGNDKYPCWLGVQMVEGKQVAKFLGRAGGVGKLDENNLKFEDGTVKFNAWGRDWTGKVEGNTIDGTWKKNDGEGKWTAKRFNRKMDVSGTWSLTIGDKKATLKLQAKKRNIDGTWSEGGKDVAISQAERKGGQITFKAGEQSVSLSLKGDVATGAAGEAKITGQRERKWGKPIELFAGKEEDLKANWEGLGTELKSWKVIDGIMTNGTTTDPEKAGHGSENLVTKRKDFNNFKLHVEFMVPPHGNSGVYLRGRYEVQVQDDFGKPLVDGVCGSLYTRVLPKVNACKKAGEWQTYDIELVDGFLTVLQNDQKIIDNAEVEGITGGAIDSNEAEPGPIYLQGDHSQIFYRKVVLTPAE
jgi:hypothetical protein